VGLFISGFQHPVENLSLTEMNEIYQFQFHPYKYPFPQPLLTSHGNWAVREGIIVSLRDDNGRIGRGEIAPLPWFGSETFAMARNFCHQLGEEVNNQEIAAIPDSLPATQFGIISAQEALECSQPQIPSLHYTYLLPAGAAALQVLASYKGEEGTFKWKIGVGDPVEEREILAQLAQILPPGAKLRLDANGGLTLPEAQKWLEVTDQMNLVEFLEQPLPHQQFPNMLALSYNYQTTLALDESVATAKQLEACYHGGWKGIFVIKAAIAGSPQRLRRFCHQYEIDAVFSSVFETSIGRTAVLRLAAELSSPHRAVGFGVNHWLF